MAEWVFIGYGIVCYLVGLAIGLSHSRRVKHH